MTQQRSYAVEGVVLKRKNVGEADRILTVFTKHHGKIRALAKGVRRITSRRSGHLEVFGFVRLMLHRGRTFDLITEASIIDGFEDIRSDLSKVSFAYYVCELVDQLLPEQHEHEEVYELLPYIFGEIGKSQTEKQRGYIVVNFALVLLRLLGFLPETVSLTPRAITPYVEDLIERKMKSPPILQKLR